MTVETLKHYIQQCSRSLSTIGSWYDLTLWPRKNWRGTLVDGVSKTAWTSTEGLLPQEFDVWACGSQVQTLKVTKWLFMTFGKNHLCNHQNYVTPAIRSALQGRSWSKNNNCIIVEWSSQVCGTINTIDGCGSNQGRYKTKEPVWTMHSTSIWFWLLNKLNRTILRWTKILLFFETASSQDEWTFCFLVHHCH